MKMQNILLMGLSFEVSAVAVRHMVVTMIADEWRAMCNQDNDIGTVVSLIVWSPVV